MKDGEWTDAQNREQWEMERCMAEQYTPSLKVLRCTRTRESNRVRRMREWMLTTHATHTTPDGLPSWWPFWSDCLKGATREAVRAARALAEREGIDL